MPRRAKNARPRPAQGAHLLALRRRAGLTQVELGRAIGEPQVNVAFWERSSTPPKSSVLPKMAKALGVRVEDLILVGEDPTTLPRRAGPVSQLQRAFEEVRTLPRSEQRKIMEMVLAVVDRYKRKAG